MFDFTNLQFLRGLLIGKLFFPVAYGLRLATMAVATSHRLSCAVGGSS